MIPRTRPTESTKSASSPTTSDVLLDILGRLFTVGDVRTAPRTSIPSRRWRHLPWPEIPQVSLDVGSFFVDSDEWCLVEGRHRFWRQHHATVGFTDALARFLAAPPSKRSIQRLSLAFILMRRDYVRRIGDLVGDASDTGRVKNVELEILTEMSCSSGDDAPLMVTYSERFRDFLKDCPGAFRSLTKLTLESLWFKDQDALRNLVRGCNALEFLSLMFCGLFRPRSPDLDDIVIRPAVLTIDAPQSRLKALVCDQSYIERIELVQAPALVEFQHRWFFDDHPPISFGCVPLLRSLSLTHHPHRQDDDGDIDVMKWKLSELLARDGNQIQTLRFDFENDEISDHICRGEWRKRRGENTNLTWQPPSPGFMQHNLKKLSFRRAFNVYKDMRFARLIMELAVNPETLTFGVKTLECKDCVAAEPNFPDPARSRLRLPGNSEHVDAVVKKLKDGISTSALINYNPT
ncbi:hypothetical protein PAHAL_1G436500 [Panicum hallii]|uniref:FBD domain-containing protein n=1 Tax=Panicum hallii TaxID=206008 RepID=A0A2T8KY87_9POAL|nr:hypothetical protein PAHAL_1G436500 [Panicum hallii]